MGALAADLAAPPVELVETHAAWVFLGRDTVWKVKKPVDFGFLDFTTMEKRKAVCEAEVRLNARLSPSVYRGVVPVTLDENGRHCFGGEGPVVDWAVCMMRLPRAACADVLLAEGRLHAGKLEELAVHLARFHERLGPSEDAARFGTPEVISANVSENFSQAKEAARALLGAAEEAEIERHQVAFVEEHAALLRERIRRGRVRDGHGDLRLEHVYFTGQEAPTVLDCIEFNDRFRFADVCADIAFLSMDLRRAGRSDLAEAFLAAYARESRDYELYALVDFYEAYRAYVRGKVACFVATAPGIGFDARTRAEREARSFFLLSLVEGRRTILEPALIAVGGIIASGKSTIANQVGALLNAPVIDADRTRKAIVGVEAAAPLRDEAWSGAYSPEMTQRVYAWVREAARTVLSSGRPVVLDASFRTAELRAAARALAEEAGVPFHFVECRVSEDECRRRLERRALGPSVSDGRTEIFDAFKARFEPVTELPESEHVVLDTGVPVEQNVERLRRSLPSWPEGFRG